MAEQGNTKAHSYIGFHIEKDVQERLDRAARLRFQSRSGVLRMLVTDFLKKEAKVERDRNRGG